MPGNRFRLRGEVLLSFYLLILLLCGSRGSTSAFRTDAIGSRARALGGAYVALADDTTACYWNPAGLAFIPVQLTQVEGRLDNINLEYTPPGGTAQHNIPHAIFIPTLGTVIPLHTCKWPWLGLLGYVSYGFRLDWNQNAAYRYNVTFDELHVQSLGAGTAYKPNNCFAVGIAAFENTANVTLANQVPSTVYAGVPDLPDASFKAVGNDMAPNVITGVLWRANRVLRVGAVYRSPIDLTIAGSSSLTLPNGQLISDNLTLPLNLPQSASFGAAWQAAPVTLVVAQVDWVDWSSIDKEVITFSNGALPNEEFARDWKGRVKWCLGTEYSAYAPLILRAGYSFDPTPAPQNTLDPMLFDLSRQSLSAGFGICHDRWTLDASYQHAFGQTRTVTTSINPIPTPGSYQGGVDVYTITLSYR